jgi:sigma-B regulation protein RsbU (phosphoserine phosphatase)
MESAVDTEKKARQHRTMPLVLVIDDSTVDRLMMTSVLQKEGFQVSAASDGMEGIIRAAAERPDIILLDVMMPDLSGFETCDRLKRNSRTSNIPVIFLSAMNDLQSRVSGLNGGAVDYIIKPFEREEVLARIRIHLRIREAFDALIEKERDSLRELKEAQQSILVRPEEMPEAKFAVHYRPLNQAGGDFYEVVNLGDSISGYFSADIGGHGIGAAFITAALKALLRQNFSSLFTPLEVMTLLNAVLCPILPEGVLLSAACVRVNRRTRRMVCVLAGHPPIIHLKADGEMNLISLEGDLLGAFDNPYFESIELPVTAGDRLIFYTDGLIEEIHGQSVQRNEGMNNLTENAIKMRTLPLSDMVEKIVTAISVPGEVVHDDILMMAVEV